jgi:Recombination endonuclease VII
LIGLTNRVAFVLPISLKGNDMNAQTKIEPPDTAVVIAKACTRCGGMYGMNHYFADKRKRDGVSSHCRKCHAEASVRWQNANREKMNETRRSRYSRNRDGLNEKRRLSYDPIAVRWNNLERLYGLKQAAYEKLFDAQNGGCAICGDPPMSRALAVDHDHNCCPSTPTCGQCTRGLLCSTCNTSLHAVEEKAGWLEKAAAYVAGGMS